MTRHNVARRTAATPQPLAHNRQTAQDLCDAALRLRERLRSLSFSAPITCVYNPLEYAWEAYEAYIRRYGCSSKRILFLGMNPGPFGMVQTGIPFGEVNAVKRWIGIETPIQKPASEHPRRPILGFSCPRSEVSGRRVWQLFEQRFVTAEAFFSEHFVLNYCPLAFVENSGRNRTPDKLLPNEKTQLLGACDEHLSEAIHLLKPQWAIGIGGFAAARLMQTCPAGIRCGQILHPSPANPTANRDWAGAATRQLQALGVW